jgi:hypothetical protein
VNQQLNVIYIAGTGRSGSTLLERILAEQHEVVAVGELRYLWEKDLPGGELCGCGDPLNTCAFWVEVLERAFGGVQEAFDIQIRRIRASIERYRYIPGTLVNSNYRKDSLEEYLSIFDRLYQAIALVSGKRTIVDSSKDPRGAFLINHSKNVDLKLLHLIRDPRAVAYSWMKVKERPEFENGSVFMHRYPSERTAWRWSYKNLLLRAFRNVFSSYLQVRYEDFVSQPRLSLERINRSLLTKEGNLDFLTDKTVKLSTSSHTISGNPMRFRQGSIEIRADYEWQEAMTEIDRLKVLAVAWPMMLASGYLAPKLKINSKMGG